MCAMAKFKTQEDMARAGGNAIKKKYGKSYFKELVNKRWDRVRQEKAKTASKQVQTAS